jgi:hypothetical protein
MNLSDKNSVIVNYYQHGPATVKESVTNELLTVSVVHHLQPRVFKITQEINSIRFEVMFDKEPL